MSDIEVTTPVVMNATLSFDIPKSVWDAMTPAERKAKVSEEAAVMQRSLDKIGGHHNGQACLYGVIEECEHDSTSIYDPEAEG